MSDELPQETESTESESSQFAWFLAGAVIGVSAALLFAPKSGKDTRQYLSDKSRDALGETGKNFIDAGREMFERGRQLVDDASDLFERGRKLMEG